MKARLIVACVVIVALVLSAGIAGAADGFHSIDKGRVTLTAAVSSSHMAVLITAVTEAKGTFIDNWTGAAGLGTHLDGRNYVSQAAVLPASSGTYTVTYEIKMVAKNQVHIGLANITVNLTVDPNTRYVTINSVR